MHNLIEIPNEWYVARGTYHPPSGSLYQLDTLTSQAYKLPQKHVRTTVSRESKSRAVPTSPRCAQLELVMGCRLFRGSRYTSLLLGIIVTGVPNRQLIKRTQRAYLVPGILQYRPSHEKTALCEPRFIFSFQVCTLCTRGLLEIVTTLPPSRSAGKRTPTYPFWCFISVPMLLIRQLILYSDQMFG